MAEFLINNSEDIEDKYIENMGSIEVNLDDKLSHELVKGNMNVLKNSKKNIKMACLLSIIERDESIFDEIDDLESLFILCKIFNSFGHLNRIKNPCVLAAILLYNNIQDRSSLDLNRESRIIKAALDYNVNEYLSNRVIAGYEYYNSISSILEEAVILNKHNQLITSPAVIEYFWYKVMSD